MMPKQENIIGKRYGKLVVHEQVPRPEGRSRDGRYWRCVCDCGGERVTYTNALTSGYTKSCGCLVAEAGVKARLDITGEQYGILRALNFSHITKQGAFWAFKCDCGTTTTLRLKDVRNGNTASCGCMQPPPGPKNTGPKLDISRPWRKRIDDSWIPRQKS